MSFASRAAVAALVTACLGSATALAGPTVGVSYGATEAQGDANNGDDANHTLGLFLRGRINRVLSLQAEVSKLATDPSDDSSIRSVNATAIFDLVTGGSLVPFALVGVGADFVSTTYTYSEASNSTTTYKRIEAGGGLEYRFRGGLVLGANLRIGDRDAPAPMAEFSYGSTPPVATAKFAPLYVPSSSLSGGQYRSAQLTLGVRSELVSY